MKIKVNCCFKALSVGVVCYVAIATWDMDNDQSWGLADLERWRDLSWGTRETTLDAAVFLLLFFFYIKTPWMSSSILTLSVPESWVATRNGDWARNRNWESQSRCQAQEWAQLRQNSKNSNALHVLSPLQFLKHPEMCYLLWPSCQVGVGEYYDSHLTGRRNERSGRLSVIEN